MRPLAATLLALTALIVAPRALAAGDPAEQQLFDTWLSAWTGMSVETLHARLAIPATPAADGPLSRPPSGARAYDRVVDGLNLDAAARAQLERDGLVLVTPDRRYSMAAALSAICARDLPLLVTTDAIVDAVHRSFDKVLAELETESLRPALRAALDDVRAELPALAQVEGLTEAAGDLDLYLTVALNLVASDPDAGRLSFAPLLVEEQAIVDVLAHIPDDSRDGPGVHGDAPATLYGAPRAVEWTQFKPRGHYAGSDALKRYFRALTWLGRLDTGFALDDRRQLRAAALLALALERSGASAKVLRLRDVVDLFVGRSGDLSPPELAKLLDAERIDARALARDETLAHLSVALARSRLGQDRISRGRLVPQAPSPMTSAPPPLTLQLFRQRFAIDSFVMARVVHDRSSSNELKPARRMPSPLDVMAALGNDLAVQLLGGELRRWSYAANLATLRAVFATWDAGCRPGDAWYGTHWGDSLDHVWLDALRSLGAPPAGHIPEAMRRTSWGLKMLQTQLASWAQLRHGAPRHTEPSDIDGGACADPDTYLEPYPALYAKLGRFAREASRRLSALRGGGLGATAVVDRHVAYFDSFAQTMAMLTTLADKELGAVPLSNTEERFLRHAIEVQPAGDGAGATPPARLGGWYLDLIYRAPSDHAGAQIAREPTIADVHTDLGGETVLEVGTGDVQLAVVAIDGDGDGAIHVGPTFTYYGFHRPASERLTGEQWSAMVRDPATLPSRPAWIRPLLGGTAEPE